MPPQELQTISPISQLPEDIRSQLLTNYTYLIEQESESALDTIQSQIQQHQQPKNAGESHYKYLLEGLWYFHKGLELVNSGDRKGGIAQLDTAQVFLEKLMIEDGIAVVKSLAYHYKGLEEISRYNIDEGIRLSNLSKEILKNAQGMSRKYESMIDHAEPNTLFISSMPYLTSLNYTNATILINKAAESANAVAKKYYTIEDTAFLLFSGTANLYSSFGEFSRYLQQTNTLNFSFYGLHDNEGSQYAKKAIEQFSQIDQSLPGIHNNYFLAQVLFYLCQCYFFIGNNLNSLLMKKGSFFDLDMLYKDAVLGKKMSLKMGDTGLIFSKYFDIVLAQIQNLRLMFVNSSSRQDLDVVTSSDNIMDSDLLKAELKKLISANKIHQVIEQFLIHTRTPELLDQMIQLSAQWKSEEYQRVNNLETKEQNTADRNNLVDNIITLINKL